MRISAALIVIAFGTCFRRRRKTGGWRSSRSLAGRSTTSSATSATSRTIPWNDGGRYISGAARADFRTASRTRRGGGDHAGRHDAPRQCRGVTSRAAGIRSREPCSTGIRPPPATQVFFNDRDPQTAGEIILRACSSVAAPTARARIPLRRNARRQQRHRAEWRPVSGDQLRPSRPCGRSPATRALTTSRRTSCIRQDDGIHVVDVAGRRAAACSCGVAERLADLIRFNTTRTWNKKGAVHQPHAVEPRRQPHLFLCARRVRRPCCAPIDIPAPSGPDGSGLTMHPAHEADVPSGGIRHGA